MKKKILASLLCLILIVSLAIPAFAEQPERATVPSTGLPYVLACWNGQLDVGGNMMLLNGNGINVTMSTSNLNTKSSWLYLSAPHGNTYLRNEANPQEVVNIYRVLQSGIYYECRGYWYDHSTQGRDQRIVVSGSKIYLAQPLVSGTWYLQADRSAVSASPIIFYTDGSRPQAQWVWRDSQLI